MVALLAASRTDSAQQENAVWVGTLVDLASQPGEPQLDAIINRLSRLSEKSPRNANIHNDLAVAYLVRAGGADASRQFEALEQIEYAHTLDSVSLPIAFNRALIYGRMHLDDAAALAWSQYASKVEAAEWSKEARERETLIRAKVWHPFQSHGVLTAESQRDPQGAREYALDSLLPAWAEAIQANDLNHARAACFRVGVVGAVLVARSDDSTVHHMASLCAREAHAAARAVIELTHGMKAFRAEDYATATPRLEHAARVLRLAGGGAVAGWGELMRGGIDMYAARYGAARVRWRAIEEDARLHGDVALRARVVWTQGLSAGKQGRTAEGLDYTARSESLFHAVGERANDAVMLSQLADIQFLLGRDDEWLVAKSTALANLDVTRDFARRSSLLITFGRQLRELGLPHAGLAVLREAAISSARTGRPSDRVEMGVRLGEAELEVGAVSEARSRLATARALLATVSDTITRDFVETEVDAAEATSAHGPAIAVARWTNVIAYYRTHGLKFGRAAPLASRAHSLLAMGDTTAAERDLVEAVSTIESHSADPGNRAAMRDLSSVRRAVFRELVGIQIARHDTVAALKLSVQSRGQAAPLIPRVGAGHMTLVYQVLPDAVVAWILSPTGIQMIRTPVVEEELRRQVSRLNDAVRRDERADVTLLATRLHEILIAPVMAEIEATQDLSIMPEGTLNEVPFALLRSGSGRYLVEDVPLTYITRLAARAPGTPRMSERVTLVSNPAFSTALFPELASLVGAARETRAMRKSYPHATIVEGAQATKAALLRALRASSVLHFAGHARLVSRSPWLSHMVLAKAEGRLDANSLTAGEIASMDLHRMSLVILSSCSTLQRASKRNENSSSLSAAFLDAGVHQVISSLWEVDDEASADLMISLHTRLARGVRVDEALRQAQVEMIREGRHPVRGWSAFRSEQ